MHSQPRSRTPVEAPASRLREAGAAVGRDVESADHDDHEHFGAESRGGFARCLRFVGWVAPSLHARLASGLLAKR